MSRRRTGLATRIALVTTFAAAIAVLIAGVVLARVISRAADDTGRKVLKQYASLSVDAADVSRTGRVAVRAQIIALLRTQQVQLVVVQPDGLVTGPGGAVATAGILTPNEVAELKAGRSFSEVRRLSGGHYYLEGRPITSGGAAGGGVVLVQKVADARSAGSQVGLRLLVALIAGLVVAALTGVLLARRLARPLQHAAGAARRLSTGARDVRLVPEGPAEVAAVADALNALSGALTTSEGRQREFLLSISHELRTPLTAVKGYAEALADGVVPPAAVEATGHVLLAESSRLERLVSDLLDLARLGAEDFRIDVTRLDLVALVRQAATVWSDRCLKEGVEFSLEAPDWAVFVDTDPTRVRQIIDGLAENALRVTPAGRPIVFFVGASSSGSPGGASASVSPGGASASMSPGGASASMSPGGASASVAIMQVRDGGPGLTEDDCKVAFDRSALYDRYRGVRRVGTGVGLALVAGLTARLGGRAAAGRAPEGGACFTITLPLEPRG